jgi:hypothetical protein
LLTIAVLHESATAAWDFLSAFLKFGVKGFELKNEQIAELVFHIFVEDQSPLYRRHLALKWHQKVCENSTTDGSFATIQASLVLPELPGDAVAYAALILQKCLPGCDLQTLSTACVASYCTQLANNARSLKLPLLTKIFQTIAKKKSPEIVISWLPLFSAMLKCEVFEKQLAALGSIADVVKGFCQKRRS